MASPLLKLCYSVYIDSYHLHHLNLSLYSQLIKKRGQISLHLDAIVIHLGYGKDAHPAFPPNLSVGYRLKVEKRVFSQGTNTVTPYKPLWFSTQVRNFSVVII